MREMKAEIGRQASGEATGHLVDLNTLEMEMYSQIIRKSRIKQDKCQVKTLRVFWAGVQHMQRT